MLYFSKWKTFFILAAVLLGFFFALPNGLNEKTRENLPGMFQRTINLGLDLQGGAHMLLEVDLSSVVEQALDNELEGIRAEFRAAERLQTEFLRVEDNAVIGRFRKAEDVERGMRVLENMSEAIDPTSLNPDKTTDVDKTGERDFKVSITPANIEAIQKRTIEQSIEVLRRRIDPTGTTEMTLAREGDDRILLQVPGAKNVGDIKDRINKTANLSFRMVRPESNSERAMQLAAQGKFPPGSAYFPQQQGGGLLVEKRTKITGECLKSSSEGIHPQGSYPIVNFTFNIKCAKIFGDLTSRNLGKRFAVVLDNEWLSYGIRFGTIANMALTINIMLIAGALSLLGATLTLPGIAGIILTIGMAVDANVLIFERIREEAHNGRPPVNAIETGYRLSLAPILDANITTLIAAVTLYFVGSGPIRGFAVTLAIGIVMSVFTAVIVARLMTATWLRRNRPKTLPI